MIWKKSFILIAISIFLGSLIACGAAQTKSKEVVVYTAIDQVFGEKIIKDFEKETGIKVKVVYDTEANKTTGLVNRIIAEKHNPICDVFWNNEFVQTITLENQGVLDAYISPSATDIPQYYKSSSSMWTAVGGRARVFLVNNDLLSKEDFPTSIEDFTSGKYSGKQLAIAYPMFGTTKTMAAALYAQWGKEKAKKFFTDIINLGVNVVDGNSVTKDMAAKGQVAIGFTDSDDAREAIEDGAHVSMVYPDQGDNQMGTLVTPSTVALIKGAPNKENAKIFIDYILKEKTERKLVEDGFYDLSIRDAKANGIKGMTLSLEEIYHSMEVSAKDMEELFATAK